MARKETQPPVDENAGKGGRYVKDTKTGQRTLVSRTLSPRDAAAQGQPDPAPMSAPAPQSAAEE